MVEAYKVGITIALTNQISRGLMMIQGDLAKTDAQAKKLHATLGQIKKLGIAGAILGGAGFMGLRLLEKSIAPAKEYAHQLNIMNMAGMKQAEIAESIKLAWKTSSDIMTTTPTQNLRSILDLKNITGSLEEAKQLLPIVSKIQTVMAASSEGNISKNAADIAFSMGKALDIIGAVRDPAELVKQAGMMSKAITATQNRVTPQMFQGVFQYARQGKFDLSDEFKYEILPTLMLEASTGKGGGGGSKGVGPMVAAMYRVTNQGYINKKSLSEWEKLGYVNGHTALKTTTSGTTVGAMKDATGAASNPFVWVNQLVDTIKKKYGTGVSDQFIRQELNGLFRGNQLAASLAVEFFTKQQNFLRDQKILKGSMGYEAAFNAAMKNDPDTAEAAAEAQWKMLKIATGNVLIPVVIPAMLKLADAIRAIGQWTQRHPNMFKDLIYGFAGLSAALLFSGSILTLKAAFLGIQLLMPTLAGIITTSVVPALGVLAAALLPLAAIAYHKEIAGAVDSAAPGIGDKLYGMANGLHQGPLRNFLLGDGGTVAPPLSSKQQSLVANSYMDGRKVTTVVNGTNEDASRYSYSGNGFNGRTGIIQPDWGW